VRPRNYNTIMKLACILMIFYLILVVFYILGSCNFPGCNELDSTSTNLITFLDMLVISSTSVVLLGQNLKLLTNGGGNRLKQATVFVIELIILFSVVQFLFLALAVQINKYITGIDLLHGDKHGAFFMFPLAASSLFIGISLAFGAALLLMLPIEERNTK